jgi:hypothetical protein
MPGDREFELEGRVFKTSRFAKVARKARISDIGLCEAIVEVMKGQCDDLGGGVFKKRLNKNMHRGIILAKGKRLWVFEDIFAKKDLANLDDDELADFKLLAKAYEGLTEQQLKTLLRDGDLVEICDGDQD